VSIISCASPGSDLSSLVGKAVPIVRSNRLMKRWISEGNALYGVMCLECLF
jgi:hypothetical protein